jgi:hypothetical protein
MGGSGCCTLFREGSHSTMGNCRSMSIVSNFPELSEFIIHDHVLHYVELNSDQHGFTKSTSISTTTNLATFLDPLTPVVLGQCHVHIAYFGISSSFDLVPHNLLLQNFSFPLECLMVTLADLLFLNKQTISGWRSWYC